MYDSACDDVCVCVCVCVCLLALPTKARILCLDSLWSIVA
jgi:hypothetical protein